MTPSSPSTFAGCNPIDGSSSTYNTPVVRLRTARASCTRWRSPVDSVAPARSKDRYPRPSSNKRRDVLRNDSQMALAMVCICGSSDSGTDPTQETSASRDIAVA